MKLTQKTIANAKYGGDGKSRFVLYDDQIPGFGLRVYPSGKKSFILRYRTEQRRERLITLGKYGALTLHRAREMALAKLTEVNEGGDPLASREKVRQGRTMNDLCDAYVKRHAKVHKKTWKEDERRIKRHIKPKWGNRKVESITRAEIATFHGKLGETAPFEANRTVELLQKMFNLAAVWGYKDETLPNPATKVDRFKEKKRDRWIIPQEFPRLVEAIEAEENIFVRAAFWLYFLTGVRKSELLKAKWEDIDLERAELHLHDTKAGRSHMVPLSTPAVEILKALPQLEDNPYVIPGAKKGHHFVNIQRSWERIRKAAKLEDVRLHDIRRSTGSWLATSGVSLIVIGKTLNHSTPLTTASVYARLSEDPVRKALDDHAQQVMALAGKKPVGEVVNFDQSKRKR